MCIRKIIKVKRIGINWEKKMKIICDNQEEYEQVLKGCNYIHDYTIDIKGVSKKTKIEIIKEWGNYYQPKEPVTEKLKPLKGKRHIMFSLDFEEYPFINFLAHGIYDCSEDIRKKYIEVKNENSNIN